MSPPADANPCQAPAGGWLAGVSLSVAAVALLVAALAPEALSEEAGMRQRAGLAVLLLGAAGAAAHGLRWRPNAAPLRFLASPCFAWPACVIGAATVLAA
jgi:hypothetical protein